MRIFSRTHVLYFIVCYLFLSSSLGYSKDKKHIKHITNVPKAMSKFAAWAVYKYKVKNQTVCYALSVPIKIKPQNNITKNSYFLISKRPNTDSLEPQFLSGGQLHTNNFVKLNIISKNKNIAGFNMYIRNQFAWLRSANEEKKLIAAMQKGAKLDVTSPLANGTLVNYSFSLIGLQKALHKVSVCR